MPIISPAFLVAFYNLVSEMLWECPEIKVVTYVHGIATGRHFASVALSESPEEGVSEGVLLEVTERLLLDLEGGEVG